MSIITSHRRIHVQERIAPRVRPARDWTYMYMGTTHSRAPIAVSIPTQLSVICGPATNFQVLTVCVCVGGGTQTGLTNGIRQPQIVLGGTALSEKP